MSDVSSFVRRGQSDSETINKLQALITPLAFADPEADSLKERVILSNPIRKRTLTSLTGLDITNTSTATRDRFGSSITLLPDTSTPTTFPVTPSLTGTLTFPNKINGAGALFTGSQYISIPDDNQLDLTLPFFTVAFWFKSNGTNDGTQTIWSKGSFTSDADYCLSCGDYDTDDYDTVGGIPLTPGLEVRVEANLVADYSSDFDVSHDKSTATERVRVIISDGINLVNSTVDTTNIFDGSWHSVIIVSTDSISDYCVACTDYSSDYSSVTTPIITVYMDKVSQGTIDHSTITGDLSNTENAILGASDTSLSNPLVANLALFEYQGTNWDSTDITDFHDNARIRVANQKAAFHFIGNDSTEDTLANVI
jgi:hypothetical protein